MATFGRRHPRRRKMTKTAVVIENVHPLLDGGRYAIKRLAGDPVHVTADIFKDGHDVIAAAVKWRMAGAKKWQEAPMTPGENDVWSGSFTVTEIGDCEYTVEAWLDAYGTWRDEFRRKYEGGQEDLGSEALEGVHLLEQGASRAGKADASALRAAAEELRQADRAAAHSLAARADLAAIMAKYPDRAIGSEFHPFGRIMVERQAALFAAWYEFFPRSAEGRGDRGSTFRDCLARLDDAQAMGFDVVYFPPIHPIGTAIPGCPMPSATVIRDARTAADIATSRLSSARWRISSGWSARRKSADSRSRSISPSTARRTIRM
jgi:starch synthase (maltosyl-transferring)